MRYLLGLLSCIHVMTGCTKNSQSTKSINIDHSNLVRFDEALKDISTAKSPALYLFKKNKKNLIYLASKHETDVSSETFKFVKYVFETKNIDVVILEGFETKLGLNPESIKTLISTEQTSDFYPNGEPSFAMEIAIKNGIPFIGGEPSDKDIYSAVLQKGYNAQDLIGFNFVRRIPQLKRSKILNSDNSLESSFVDYSKTKAQDFGIENFKFSYDDFKKWYHEKQGKELTLNSGELGETAPIEGPYFTQTISKTISIIRDEHILKTISEMLQNHNNVFIVYGSSHYRIQHKALKGAFGMPTEVDIIDVPFY